MTAITTILTSAEESISSLTGYKVRLRMTRVKDAMWQMAVDMDMVLMAVERAYGIDTDKLRSRSRKRPIPQAKRLACKLLEEHIQGISLNEIAREVGLQEHTTVMYHLRVGSNLLETDGAFISKYNEAKRMLETI